MFHKTYSLLYICSSAILLALGNVTDDVIKEPHFSDDKHSTEDRVVRLEQMVQKLSTEYKTLESENKEMKKRGKTLS